MSFGQAVIACFAKYATFTGRATRAEYWYWTLSCTVVGSALLVIGLTSRYAAPLLLFDLATMPPTAAVTVRRLHDLDRSGWSWLIGLVPLIGFILLIVRLCTRGTAGPNRFGAPPA